MGNRSGISHGEKNGNPYEVFHVPVLVRYKTYLMLLYKTKPFLYQNVVGLNWERIFENTKRNVWIAVGKGVNSWGSPRSENFKVYTVAEFSVQK